MDCHALTNIIKLLEDGCLSSQSLEQITGTLVRQILKVLKSKREGVKCTILSQLRELLENTRYLVLHNKGCFEHLKDVGFLNLICETIHTITEDINGGDMTEDIHPLVELATETVLAISEMSSQAKANVVLYLLPNIIELLLCDKLTFLNRLEILKNINVLLEQCHVQTKDEFLKNSDNQEKITALVNLIQAVGDYEFQVGTIECLMRLFPRKLRQHYATMFMTHQYMLNGFLEIKDRDFETDCRHFLNIINAKSEDPNQGVYSIPCLSAYVGNKELRKPSDASYSEFWVDFNIGSQRVTIFCEQDSLLSQSSAMDEDLWETVAVYKTDVKNCICNEEEEGLIILEIQLKSPVCDIYPSQHQDVRDNTITIEFSSDLELHVSHAVAQTFREPERASKVSTVEQPLQISLKEVQETDSQQSMSSAVPQKSYQPIRDDCSQESSSTRRHKVSVPSVPMCSPLVRVDGSSGQQRTKEPPIPKQDCASASKQTSLAEKVTEDKTIDLPPPRTPVVKSKPRGKVKTPVVVVTPLEAKSKKKGKKKQKGKKESVKNKDTTECDLVIPDSLPVEDVVQIDKLDHLPKVSTSVRGPEDNGIGVEISAHNITEGTLFQKDKKVDETTSSEDANLSSSSENQIGIPAEEKESFPNEAGDGKNIKRDRKSINSIKSNTDTRNKNEKTSEVSSDSIESSDENKDINSIPDSYEGCESQVLQETSKTNSKQEECKSIEENYKETKIDKPVNKGKGKTEKKSKKEQTVSLALLSKDHESLEELYKFDEIEMNKTKNKKNKREDKVKEGINPTEQNDKCNIDSFKDSKKENKNKSKLSKKTKNNLTAEETRVDNKDKLTKTVSKEPARRSGRSSGKKPSYKELDTSMPTGSDKDSDISMGERPEKKEKGEEISFTDDELHTVHETEIQKEEETDNKTKQQTTKSDIKLNIYIESDQDENLEACENENDKNESSQYYVTEQPFSPLNEDANDVTLESVVEISKPTNKKENKKNKIQKSKSKQSKSKTTSRTKKDLSSSDNERCTVENNKKEYGKKLMKEKYDEPSENSDNELSGSIETKIRVNDNKSSKDNKCRGSRNKSKLVVYNKQSDSYDDDSSDELYIEEDDSYNARRYRLESSQERLTDKQDNTSKSSTKKQKCNSIKREKNNKSLVQHDDDDISFSDDEKKKINSKLGSSKIVSNRSTTQNKKANKTLPTKANKKAQHRNYSNETVSVACKGRVGFVPNDPFDRISAEPSDNAKNKSMTVQMTYSKSKTSYRLYDWSTETSVDRKPGYDPYDFDDHWDNQSMKSDSLNRKDTKANTSSDTKPKKKNSRSRPQQEVILIESPESVHESESQSSKEDSTDNNLLFQDTATKKWHRQTQKSKIDTSYQKPIQKKGRKCTSKSKIKRDEETIMMDTTAEDEMEIPVDNFEDDAELKYEEPEEVMEVKSFSEIMKEMAKSAKHEKQLALPNVMTPKTPKTVDFADNNEYDYLKTPCTLPMSSRTPNIGSCRRKGYTPLSVSFVKTPQSAQTSEKPDTESEDTMDEGCSSYTRKQQAERRSGRKGRSSTDVQLLESEKSWIAEKKNSAKKKLRSKTYKKTKPAMKKPQYDDPSEEDDESISEEQSNTQKLSCFSKALQQLRQTTELSLSDEPADEPDNSGNLEICSLPNPSIFSLHSQPSNPVTPSGKLSYPGSVSLDHQILSPVTPYKAAQEEDDIQVIQTQENYALSFNMEDQEPQEFSDKLMKQNLQTLLGDSGFASGPSSEVRPSRSTLKRKYPDMAHEELEYGTADSDSQSEKEEDRSTFIPKKLFKAEDMFKMVSTPKTLSVYSDITEDTEVEMPFQTGMSSFISAFGADIQKQFKAKRQRVEALTKETLKSTQKHLNQTMAVQHQQSALHDDYMNNIVFELSELTKDVDRLKEAEQKTEDFYKYQIKVLRDNEQSQRARLENMVKTNLSYKDRVYKSRKQNVNVYKNMKEVMRKDMSNLEKKLIKDVQNQELMNVKRGLQNLF